jgi:hypothetical protein
MDGGEMSELTGLVQIDVGRRIGPQDNQTVEMMQIAQRVLDYVSPPGTVAAKSPGDARKAFKAKEVQCLDKLKQALVVSDDDSFQTVGMLVAEAATIIKAIEVDIAPEKKLASDLHKLLCDREANAQAPYEWVKRAGDQNLNAYRVKQKREADELARKEQEAAQAEQRRLQAEADNKLRQQRELEAKALQAKREGDMATAREAQQGAASAAKIAEVMQERAVAVVEEIQHAPVSVPKIAGRVEKWPWRGTVVDRMALIKAIANGEVKEEHVIKAGEPPVHLVEFNDAVIQYYAKRLEANAVMTGVKFEEHLVSAQRTK